jgi:hypothetical protein
MRGTLIAALAVGFAALVFPGKPATAASATAALSYGESHAGIVEQVGRKYRYSRKYRGRPYYRGYAYRPYYWGRPYAYYGSPYYYRRGPGVSFWFGF